MHTRTAGTRKDRQMWPRAKVAAQCLIIPAAVFFRVTSCSDGATAGHSMIEGASEIPIGSVWLAEDIGGRGVIDIAQSTVSFVSTDRVSGSGGCNRYSGPVAINGAALSFGALATTRRACPPALMNQESKFLAALADARSFAFDGPFLIFYDAAGGAVLKFTRTN
jgi:heat shock protein HslJ